MNGLISLGMLNILQTNRIFTPLWLNGCMSYNFAYAVKWHLYMYLHKCKYIYMYLKCIPHWAEAYVFSNQLHYLYSFCANKWCFKGYERLVLNMYTLYRYIYIIFEGLYPLNIYIYALVNSLCYKTEWRIYKYVYIVYTYINLKDWQEHI